MKVLLVNPPPYKNKDYIREGRCMQVKSSWAALWMPLSMTYIAAILRNRNSQVTLVDCIAEKINREMLIRYANEVAPEFIIINTAFPSIKGDLETAEQLKRALPSSKIVVFGLCPTLYEGEILEHYSFIDYGVVGEPEWVIDKLIESCQVSGSLEEIAGLIWRNGSTVISNKEQEMACNELDTLPFPARDLINNDCYTLPLSNKRFTLITVSRGCPYQCTYCVASIYYGRLFRKRRVKKMVDEIEECINTHKIRSFLFWGESFTLDNDYVQEICKEILERNLNIEWSAAARVDNINKQMLESMKQAGCIMISLGIESMNQAVLDTAKKGIRTEMSIRAITLAKEVGIRTVGHFIFGLPNDDTKSIKETIKFACKSGIDYAQFYCAVPYPKTEFGKIAIKNGWRRSDDMESLDFTKEVSDNDYLTGRDIKRYRDIAFRRFYMRPSILYKAIKDLRSIKAILSTIGFARWIKA